MLHFFRGEKKSWSNMKTFENILMMIFHKFFFSFLLLLFFLLLLSLYLKLTNIKKRKKKARKKINVNLEHREHLATRQNEKKA